MKATYAVMPDEEQLVIEHEELDPSMLDAHDILVEAETTVVSAGTELAIFTALAPGVRTPGNWNAYPWRPGYGLVGCITAIGNETQGFSPGDRVFCFGKHASHQLYDVSARTSQNSAFVIEDDLSPKTAVMIRMALIALSAPQVSTIEPGDTVCIFGLGLVGNLAAQLYQIAGAQVIALDPVASRCELAQKVGIETILSVSPEQQIEAINDLSRGKGVNVAVDAVGDTRVILNCIEVCAPFGQIILLGSPRKSFECDATIGYRMIHNRWLSVTGALEWRLPPYPVLGKKHSIESNLHMLIQLVRDHQLNVDDLVSHFISPKNLLTAYQGLLLNKEHYAGVVVNWKKRESQT